MFILCICTILFNRLNNIYIEFDFISRVIKPYPTSPFPILEPPNPWIDKFYLVQERRKTGFEAPKLQAEKTLAGE